MQSMHTIPLRRETPLSIQRMAIVVRDDAYDRLLTPFSFAWEMGRQGVRVDILFVLWAVRVLSVEGVREVTMDARHADREAWLRERLSRAGEPVSIHDHLKLLRATGTVHIHACRLAAATFGVRPQDLLPEVESIMDPSRFLHRIVTRADHVQYF